MTRQHAREAALLSAFLGVLLILYMHVDHYLRQANP